MVTKPLFEAIWPQLTDQISHKFKFPCHFEVIYFVLISGHFRPIRNFLIYYLAVVAILGCRKFTKMVETRSL